ncbi:LRR amino-terminal domain protein [Medicago truncatula]|uniref:LRR amino-terminal domain protein n=1 Tax=Medicago truncatula TaxID=3880 RepID=G7JY80_MEDTR|nr:LRR amino-terminal domain protein [Medicago truncatula]
MGNYILKLCYALFFIFLHSARSIHGHFNSTSSTKEVKCKEREKEALLRFKQGLQDDNGMLSTWRDDEKNRDCCKWKGIGCSNETGHVHMLDLHGSGTHPLIGAINLSLLIELKNIKYLDLSCNYFLGSYIPELIDSFEVVTKQDFFFRFLTNPHHTRVLFGLNHGQYTKTIMHKVVEIFIKLPAMNNSWERSCVCTK